MTKKNRDIFRKTSFLETPKKIMGINSFGSHRDRVYLRCLCYKFADHIYTLLFGWLVVYFKGSINTLYSLLNIVRIWWYAVETQGTMAVHDLFAVLLPQMRHMPLVVLIEAAIK